MTGGV